jgi:hypothetical protein
MHATFHELSAGSGLINFVTNRANCYGGAFCGQLLPYKIQHYLASVSLNQCLSILQTILQMNLDPISSGDSYVGVQCTVGFSRKRK